MMTGLSLYSFPHFFASQHSNDGTNTWYKHKHITTLVKQYKNTHRSLKSYEVAVAKPMTVKLPVSLNVRL